MTDSLDQALAAKLGRPLYDTINQHLADGQRAEAALAEARRLHRETCPLAQGAAKQPAFTCSLCTALDGPGPAATQATEGVCSDPAPETEPNTPAATPSRRAGLHDAIVGALGQIPVIPPVAHRRAQADNVLALLYREWPWLRAEAEDAAPSRADIVRVLTTTRSRIGQQAPQLEFPDHHQPGDTGHVGWCALCARDVDALTDALLDLIGTAKEG